MFRFCSSTAIQRA